MSRRIIGLTGGIACGKSTVSNYLENIYKIPVLDADIYAREAVEKGSAILERIFQRYGRKVKTEDNSLNRQQLGEIIFNNPEEKIWLESQIHPYVRECFKRHLEQLEAPIVVFSVPLLLEAKLTHLVTEIWVVFCGFEQQIERLMTRNNLSREQAIARINNQMPLAEKIALADIVLDNSGDLEALYTQIDRAISSWLELN
ncbi:MULTISPECIES: dephospho-CoA kinase [unclassified Microcystis]|jgi:dephospho-CoA kinase|uniref:Dephospho-CoA kinase n=1 Tax=Microcystis flos-aquae Mf_QC_C_20070823_S10D TaxID=2486236 RepID=A0A552KJ11_9CHRO|nr:MULTISPECIES: dephospho-CoA kinase [unclassified Microcystis]MCA2817558.1 dephospho-CoA kinase [Microcystis sp. M085S1]MCA2857101.1 dephospho-CoA kinase [Microcystis sp. M065S1]TRT94013.1 MAG: dephospho-CoA kinase [Microcystis flos-aquae Ma_QC_C_20070823_S18D]TRV07981.1 MAG: dephospho-CoA kinase [Microcystis flos-aquae Mf_QC_C_20070823_S10D]TRV20089.1 MAG: dephospho-CoA kinase [Microcystis flos-aquae Mf_QC_C_20070823_S10]TRV28835.1 MAG: dephospho-CoA kinase [Microcystis flos-aquae Mf_QC_C_